MKHFNLSVSALRVWIAAVAVLVMASGCSQIVPPKRQVIPAVVKMKITDPVLLDLAKATESVELVASGEFAPGNYDIKGIPLKVNEGTTFSLRLKTPIKNPNYLSAEDADGRLSTSQPLIIKGFSVPQAIELKDGKAIGDVDILKTVANFMLNVLEEQLTINSENEDVRHLIGRMQVQKAVMRMRPNSFYEVGHKRLHFAEGSVVQLSDIAIDKDLNYQGTCDLHLKFLKDSEWIGERTDVLFNGGTGDLRLDARRINDVLTLTMLDKHQRVTLDDCTFKWGKNKRSSAHAKHCVLSLGELTWRKTHKSAKPELHLVSKMDLRNTHVIVKTDTQTTDAQFPDTVPAVLKVDVVTPARETQFATLKTQTASVGTVEIHRPNTNLKIYLRNAAIGPIALDKFGELQFSLARGSAELDRLDWSTSKQSFTLETNGASTLTLPQGMELYSSGHPGGARLTLPISVKLGSATLKGKDDSLRLSNLKGNLVVTVDPDVSITSNLDLSIADSTMLGKHRVDVKARGLDLESSKGHALAHIKSCSVDLSEQALEEAITDEVPTSKTWTINKTFPQSKWRYKNATIKTATVNNLHIDHMEHSGTNTIKFTASGDVSIDCSVEKGGLIAALKGKESKHYEVKPWSAKGHCKGEGTVKYKLIPGSSLATSKLAYQLEMKLPVPDDVEVDWSQVTSGLLEAAEHGIIVKELKKLTVPININTKVALADAKDQQWKGIALSKLVVTPSNRGAMISFSADASF